MIESLHHGGAEVLVQKLATGMRERHRFEPIVCCFRDGPLARRLEDDGIAVERLNLQRRSVLEGPAFISFVRSAVRALRRVIDQHKVAILHAHLPDCIIPALVAGIPRGVPVIGTYHGLGILPQGRGRLDPRNMIRTTLYRMAGRLCARSIAVSPAIHDVLCHTLGFPRHKTVMLLNGVDVDAFSGTADLSRVRAELGLDGRRVVTCVGRLVPGKGQRVLIEAMAVVSQTHGAVLVLVGSGPDLAALRNRVAALGLTDRVVFAGDRSDVDDILAATDVFALPSFAEGIPLALLEAMAARVPTVATDVPGNRDVLAGMELAVAVPAADSRALASAIVAVLDDPARARAMAAEAYQRVRAGFDIRRSIEATEALYAEVVAARPHAAP